MSRLAPRWPDSHNVSVGFKSTGEVCRMERKSQGKSCKPEVAMMLQQCKLFRDKSCNTRAWDALGAWDAAPGSRMSIHPLVTDNISAVYNSHLRCPIVRLHACAVEDEPRVVPCTVAGHVWQNACAAASARACTR